MSHFVYVCQKLHGAEEQCNEHYEACLEQLRLSAKSINLDLSFKEAINEPIADMHHF